MITEIEQRVLSDCAAFLLKTKKWVLRPNQIQAIERMISGSYAIELATGEGKSTVAAITMAIYAKKGIKAHLVTLNDYLSRRDYRIFSPMFQHLNISVGLIVSDTEWSDRKRIYENSDIAYISAQQWGFDYLRNLIVDSSFNRIRFSRQALILDEIDSLLIDEVLTPLIFSFPVPGDQVTPDPYTGIREFVDSLSPDRILASENRLTEAGYSSLKSWLREQSVTEPNICYYLNALTSTLRANSMIRDVHYLVKGDQILVLDPKQGRIQYGKRFNDGVHEALEIKEGIEPIRNSETSLYTTYGLMCSMYDIRTGMSGTLNEISNELEELYGIRTVILEPNRRTVRIDNPVQVFSSDTEQENRILEIIKDNANRARPVVIMGQDIPELARLRERLLAKCIEHSVLDARTESREDFLIATAGRSSRITLCTPMASRGTDIKLGGDFELLKNQAGTVRKLYEQFLEYSSDRVRVLDIGGVVLIKTFVNHDSRNDRQAVGRVARQGEPGETFTVVSLESIRKERIGFRPDSTWDTDEFLSRLESVREDHGQMSRYRRTLDNQANRIVIKLLDTVLKKLYLISRVDFSESLIQEIESDFPEAKSVLIEFARKSYYSSFSVYRGTNFQSIRIELLKEFFDAIQFARFKSGIMEYVGRNNLIYFLDDTDRLIRRLSKQILDRLIRNNRDFYRVVNQTNNLIASIRSPL